MRHITERVDREIQNKERNRSCALYGIGEHECGGRLTREHAVIHSGRQVNEEWAIISICAKAHSVDEYQDGGELDKNKNMWIALNRTDEAGLLNMVGESFVKPLGKVMYYVNLKNRLNAKYGVYDQVFPLPASRLVN